MQAEGAGIHIRKEVTADERNRAERQQQEKAEAGQGESGVGQCPFENALVPCAKTLELAVECEMRAPDESKRAEFAVHLRQLFSGIVVAAVLRFCQGIDIDLTGQQKFDHGGHQRARKQVAGQHGEDHGHA